MMTGNPLLNGNAIGYIGTGRMARFFDVYDLPPGLSFEDVLLKRLESSTVMVVQTDSYSFPRVVSPLRDSDQAMPCAYGWFEMPA